MSWLLALAFRSHPLVMPLHLSAWSRSSRSCLAAKIASAAARARQWRAAELI